MPVMDLVLHHVRQLANAQATAVTRVEQSRMDNVEQHLVQRLTHVHRLDSVRLYVDNRPAKYQTVKGD